MRGSRREDYCKVSMQMLTDTGRRPRYLELCNKNQAPFFSSSFFFFISVLYLVLWESKKSAKSDVDEIVKL